MKLVTITVGQDGVDQLRAYEDDLAARENRKPRTLSALVAEMAEIGFMAQTQQAIELVSRQEWGGKRAGAGRKATGE